MARNFLLQQSQKFRWSWRQRRSRRRRWPPRRRFRNSDRRSGNKSPEGIVRSAGKELTWRRSLERDDSTKLFENNEEKSFRQIYANVIVDVVVVIVNRMTRLKWIENVLKNRDILESLKRNQFKCLDNVLIQSPSHTGGILGSPMLADPQGTSSKLTGCSAPSYSLSSVTGSQCLQLYKMFSRVGSTIPANRMSPSLMGRVWTALSSIHTAFYAISCCISGKQKYFKSIGMHEAL